MPKVMRDECFHDFLARSDITWQFNLSRAPWWGGQFERLIGLVKQALQTSISLGSLNWRELSEIITDVEVALNGRPLSYVWNDHQLPVLTPNSLLYPQSNVIPDLDAHHTDEHYLRKRAKHLRRCTQIIWKRWSPEYVRGLRERHNLNNQSKTLTLKPGDVVIIRGDDNDWNKRKLGVVKELIEGRDGLLRAAKLRAGRGTLERAVQQLYSLELQCDWPKEPQVQLKADAPTFRPRRAT